MQVEAVKLRSVSADSNEYKVTLHFSLKNTSTVSYELSYLAVEYYVGVEKKPQKDPPNSVVFTPVGTAPSLVNSRAAAGAFEWSPLGTPSASVWAKAIGDLGMWEYLIDPNVRINGPNTGMVVPGGSTEFDYDYAVKAKPGTRLGFVVDWIINRGKGRDDVNYLNKVVALP